MSTVSIVIPLYNRQKLIEQTIQAVVQQSHNDWELLIIDDHSTDGSLERTVELSEADKRIRCWRRESEQKGASVCRNEGLDQSSGDFVIFLDSDDVLSEHCLESRVGRLKELPQNDFVVFGLEMFDKQPGDSRDRWSFSSQNYLDDFLDVPLWQTAAPIWRRDFLQKNNLRWCDDLHSWQDWDFHIRVLCECPKFDVFENEIDSYCRRSTSGRITNQASQNTKWLEQQANLFFSTWSHLQKQGLATEARKRALIRQIGKVLVKLSSADNESLIRTIDQLMLDCQFIDVPNLKKLKSYIRFESSSWLKLPGIRQTIRRLLKCFFIMTSPDFVHGRHRVKLRLNSR